MVQSSNNVSSHRVLTTSKFRTHCSNHHQGWALILIIRQIRELKSVQPACPGNKAPLTFKAVCAFQNSTKRPDHVTTDPPAAPVAPVIDKRAEFTVVGGARFTTGVEKGLPIPANLRTMGWFLTKTPVGWGPVVEPSSRKGLWLFRHGLWGQEFVLGVVNFVRWVVELLDSRKKPKRFEITAHSLLFSLPPTNSSSSFILN